MNLVSSKFIEDVLSYIRYKKIRPSIKLELEDHIHSLKESYIEEGLEEDEAYHKAILQMGEASSVGKSLDKAHRPHMEWSVFMLLIGVITVGILTFAYWNHQTISGETPINYFMRQSVYIGIGLVVFIGAYFLDYRYFKKGAILIYALGIGMLLYTPLFGIQMNGLRRWIIIGPLSISVYTCVMPLLVIGYIGIVQQFAKEKLKDYILLGSMAIVPILLMTQGDFPTSLLTGITLVSILTFHIMGRTFKGERKKFLTILYAIVGGAGALGVLLFLQSPYRLKRIVVSYRPELDPLGSGYQSMQLKNVREHAAFIGDAGFSFVAGYMPEPLNETMFTVVIGSLGWLVGIGLILLITLIIVRMYQASYRVQESYGRLLSLGITTLFALQFVCNIGMNLGVVPPAGITLPFVSYGGTGMVMNWFLMGLFLSVYRKKDIVLLEQ